MAQLKQYLTLFINDTTTIDGVVLAAGAVPTVAQTSCSTDAAHARPYMMSVMEGVNTQVDLVEASVAIGSIQVEIQDNRRSAGQDTGWLTFLLADAGGRTALLGQRISFKQIDQYGVEYNLDMLMQEVSLNSTKTVYRITTRDMRERERTMSLFYRAEDAVIWPSKVLDSKNSGSALGYGHQESVWTGASRTIVPPSAGVRATWVLNSTDVAVPMGEFRFIDQPYVDVRPAGPQDWPTLLGQYNLTTPGVPDTSVAPTAQGSQKSTSRVTGMTVQWRPWGSSGNWTELRNFPVWYLIDSTGGAFFYSQDGYGFWSNKVKVTSVEQRELHGVLAAWHDFSLLPTNGQDVEVRVLSGLPPTEAAPLYFEGTFGAFLKRCYDGYYSLNPAGIRYNAAVMNTLVSGTPILRLIKTKSEEEGLNWLQENWYKPMRMFPLINAAGEIVPTSFDIPDATVALPVLDSTNVEEADWKHTLGDAVTGIEFQYFRDFIGADGRLDSIDVHVDTVNITGLAAAGSKPAKFAPETVREISTDIGNSYGKANISEYGYYLAKRIQAALVDRFSLGGMHCDIHAMRSDVNVRNLTAGQWVQVSLPWLPDYTSKTRGINRMMQVITIQDTDPNIRHLEVVDAGPFAAGLTAPPLANITVNSVNGRVLVTVSGVATGVYARIDVAVNPTQPAVDSPAWMMIGRSIGPGAVQVQSGQLSPGTAWIRARFEKPGTRSSGWTQFGTRTIPNLLLTDMRVSLTTDGFPTLTWTPDATIGALRLKYQALLPTDANPLIYGTTLDIDASTGKFTFPVAIPQFYRMGIDVTAYPTFTGGVATGTPGNTRRLPDILRREATPTLPTLKVATSETALLGFISMTLYDPSGMIYSVETQTYSGLIMVHDWAVVTPSAGVYTDSVPLVEKQVSIINYRMRVLQFDGTTTTIDQKPIRYAIGSIPLVPTLKYDPTTGNLLVTVTGDSDTTLIHVVVSTDHEPTPAEIDAAAGANELVGRVAQYTYPVPLVPNQRFYIATRAYNTNIGGALSSQGSIIERQTDFWVPSTAVATVQPGGGSTAVGLNSKQLTVNNILFGAMTQLVRVFIREFKTDPGVAVDVSETGYEHPLSPLRVSGGSVTIPVANPGNYFHVTLVAYDAQNRIGGGIGAWDGATQPAPVQGKVNIKARATLVAQAAPADLADLQVTISGTSTAVLTMTMPGSNLPASLRIRRDGVPLPDIARIGLAGGTQVFNDTGRSPGTTYSYQVFGVNSQGIESPVGSPVRQITFGLVTIPTPSITTANQTNNGYDVIITPGANSPAGVMWTIEEQHQQYMGSGNFAPWTTYAAAEQSTATTIFHGDYIYQGANFRNVHIRVIGRLAGYNDSLYSNEVTVVVSYVHP